MRSRINSVSAPSATYLNGKIVNCIIKYSKDMNKSDTELINMLLINKVMLFCSVVVL